MLALIVGASLFLVPAGHGPYSVVYGPKAPLRAYRASQLLLQAVGAIVLHSAIIPALEPGFTYSSSLADDALALTHFHSLPSTLRC